MQNGKTLQSKLKKSHEKMLRFEKICIDWRFYAFKKTDWYKWCWYWTYINIK